MTSAALLLVPLRDPLAWWHLFWGRVISSLGAVPAANHVRYTLDEALPAVHGSWLADLTLWSVFELGGLPLLLAARALWLGAALAIAATAARHHTSGPVTALLAATSLALALPVVEPGPALLAAPLIALLAHALNSRSLGWAPLLPLASALWANLDPTIWLIPALGAGLVLAQPAGRSRHAWLAAWLLSLVSPLLNPRTSQIFLHAVDVARSWPSSPLLGPSWAAPPAALAALIALISLALIARHVAAARSGSLSARGALVWAATLGAQALWTERGVIWLAVALAPLAALALPSRAQRALERDAWPRWSRALIGASLLLVALILQPTWAFHPDLALSASPYALRATQPHAALVLDETPIEGLALLRPYPRKPRLWIEPRWTGLALLELEPPDATPRPLVQTDPRPELGDAAHRDLERLVMTSDVWRGVFQQYAVRATLLDLRGEGRYLGEALSRHPDWHPAHQTEDYVLFLRR